MDFEELNPSLTFSRGTAEKINQQFAMLQGLLNMNAAAPLVLNQGSTGWELAVDVETLVSMAPVGSAFRIGVNGTLFPVESELNLIAGQNITLTGADNPGATRTDVTINALADGNTYIFNNDTITFSNSTITFNLDVINITNTSITFDSSDTITFNGAVILAGYIVQTPNRVSPGAATTLDPGTAQWIILSLASTSTFFGITAPTGTVDGRFLEITNESSKAAVFNDEDGGASAADRIITPDGAPYWLLPGESAFFKYDGVLARWVILWTLPHYQVNGTGGGTFNYFWRQAIDLEAGTNITLTATDDPTNSRLKVLIDAAGGTGVTGSVVNLGTPYTITVTYALITGLTITLPSAGTYAVDFSVSAEMTNFSPPGQVTGLVRTKLYNFSALADVAGTERDCCDLAGLEIVGGIAGAVQEAIGTAGASPLITVGGATVLQVWAVLLGSANTAAIQFGSIRYLKIA